MVCRVIPRRVATRERKGVAIEDGFHLDGCPVVWNARSRAVCPRGGEETANGDSASDRSESISLFGTTLPAEDVTEVPPERVLHAEL